MESEGDPEGQPFIVVAPVPRGSPARSRAVWIGCGSASAVLVLTLMAVAVNSMQAHSMKVVNGSDNLVSIEGQIIDAGRSTEGDVTALS